MKSVFLWTHRWFGIVAGLFFVLLGLSGSYLVYGDTFEGWRTPEMRLASQPAEHVSLDQAVRAAKAALGTEQDPARVNVPADADRTVELYFTLPSHGPGFLLSYVDPSNGEARGSVLRSKTPRGFLFSFHHDLFMGRTGRTIIGVAGALMLVLLLSGLYLWWPRRGFWRAFRPGRMITALQTNLELHKLAGIYSVLLMLVVTFSGVYVARPDWFQGTPPPPSGRTPMAETETVNFAAVDAAIAQSGLPTRGIALRVDRKNAMVNAAFGEGVRLGRHSFDARDGTWMTANAASTGSHRDTQYRLHAGYFWGAVGKPLVFLAGLLPLFFYATGIFVWWKKRSPRRRTVPTA